MADVSESDGLAVGEQAIVQVVKSGNPNVHRQNTSPMKAHKQALYPLPKNLGARLPRGKRIKHPFG